MMMRLGWASSKRGSKLSVLSLREMRKESNGRYKMEWFSPD